MKARYGFVLALGLLTAAFATWRPDEPFPHRKHAKLFPTCAGCHAGVIDEQASERFPAPEGCARCHDGGELRRVNWSGPHVRATNLRFSHVEHARETERGGEKVECLSCHREQATDSVRMAVVGAQPTNCITCHAHRAPEHLADNAVCSTCHVPLATARNVSDSAIAAFPRPASHARADFTSTHGPKTTADAARCATCHTRESCARCHPNAGQVAAIDGLGSDPRIARLVSTKEAVYPTPASHREPLWGIEHGGAAKRDVQQCANCHTRQGCQSCHTGKLASEAIAALPDGSQAGGPGVLLRHLATTITPASHRPGNWKMDHGDAARRDVQRCAVCHTRQSCQTCHTGKLASPTIAELQDSRGQGAGALLRDVANAGRAVRVHPPDFVSSHGTTAGSGRLTCQGCHEQRFCSDCHDGSGRYRFHKVNYVSRHAADAYGRDRNCSSCHNAETFCRTCHLNSGIASRGGVRGTAHNGQPMWLLQHGQAARQGLEGCTSCHQQRDCLRCHSASGQHMNPHGPGFKASQMKSRNAQMCLVCHATDPTLK